MRFVLLIAAAGLLVQAAPKKPVECWACRITRDQREKEDQETEREISTDLAEIQEDEESLPSWHDGVGWSGNEMSGRDFFNIKDWDQIETKSNDPQASAYVQSKIQVYYSINPADAMKKLAEVGSLLRLAYAGAKGFKSSSPIVRVLSNYQDLVKDSLITSSTFVELVLKALKYHRIAFIFVEKKKTDKALKYIKKCALMASRMAEESQLLVDKADALKQLAVDALISANDDYVGTTEEKKRIQKAINELRVAEEKQKAMKGDLDAMIKEAREEEKRNGAMAGEKEFWGMIIGVFSPLAQTALTSVLPAVLGDQEMADPGGEFGGGDLGPPLGPDPGPGPGPDPGPGPGPGPDLGPGPGPGPDLGPGPGPDLGPVPPGGGEPGCGGGQGVDGAASAARCREAAARASRVNFQQQQLKNNAELAATVAKLMQMKNEKDDLDKAIMGLEITIKTLGKVKTIFLNAKVFWEGVKKHVESLAATPEELEDYAEDEDLWGELVEELMNSGYSWLSVGKICRMAATTIREVDQGVDEIMNELPTGKEAEELIQTLGAKIIGDIKDEDEEIKEELDSPINKLPLPSPMRLPVKDVTLPQ